VSDPPVRFSLGSWLAGFDWTGPITRNPRRLAVGMLAVGALLTWRAGLHADLAAYLYFAVVGVLLTAVDVALHRLPDPLTLPSYLVVAALLAVAAPFTPHGGDRYVHALIGMAALLALYLVQWLIVPNQIGLGDVKLSGVLGLYLGWLGFNAWVLGVFSMFLLGGGFSVVLLLAGKASRKSAIAFGPFMLGGALLALLVYLPAI
jgi:leader peptidase (prepilin peptidase)/N-methyltransferase